MIALFILAAVIILVAISYERNPEKRNTCRSGDIITVIEMGTIKIEIRRNRDLSFTVKGDFAFDKRLLPKMTPEQEALQHELEKSVIHFSVAFGKPRYEKDAVRIIRHFGMK